jgi:hypothetical protein
MIKLPSLNFSRITNYSRLVNSKYTAFMKHNPDPHFSVRPLYDFQPTFHTPCYRQGKYAWSGADIILTDYSDH